MGRTSREFEDGNAMLDRLTPPTKIGTVARVKAEKGYCFVHVDGEDGDYFLHFTGLIDGTLMSDLQPGLTRVSFIVNQTAKGPRAEQARRV